IEWFLNNGIQPFMVTTQATNEPSTLSTVAEYPMRTGETVNSVINKVKYELANEYNLEIIDMNSFGEMFMAYSDVPMSQIIPDKLHFGDAGHKAEAGFLFNELCPRSIKIEDTKLTRIGLSNQKVKSDTFTDKQTYLATPIDGFKVCYDYVKNDYLNAMVIDFYIMNISKQKLNIKSSFSKINNFQYVLIDGVKTIVTDLIQDLGDLDIGLHHIQVFTGATNLVNLLGFKIQGN
ncbi:MAG: hypothetical protein ACRDA5_08365, partial [Clostridium sp.]